jgi:predicted flap endonuclease-1-like 5' DNA nuclease
MKIVEIEGIGPAYAEKLGLVGISTVEELLKRASTRTEREELALKTGIGGELILDWVNHADLMRITGVGPEFAEMLEKAGVDTILELAQRNAENLHVKLMEVNEKMNIANRTPGLPEVQKWVAEAKEIPRAVQH